MKSLFVYVLMLCIILSCSQRENQYISNKESDQRFDDRPQNISESMVHLPVLEETDLTRIKIPSKFTEAEPYIEWASLVETVRYVPLETTKESLIHSIENSMVYKSKLYILDNFGKSILVFDINGKYERRIGKHGKGPGEYINPISIEIDRSKEQLLVFDDKVSKFLVFDLEGNFIEEKKVGFRMNDFKVQEDGTFIINTDVRTNFHFPEITGNKLIYTDENFEVQAKGYGFDARNCSGLPFSRPGVYRYADNILYNPTFSYQIFSLSSAGLKPKYLIDPGVAMFPDNIECGLSFDEFTSEYDNLNTPYVYIDGPIIETDDYLLTTLKHKMRQVYFFYSKKSKEVFCALNFRFEPYKMLIYTPIIGQTDFDEFYGFIDASEFHRQADFIVENKVGEIDPKLLNISIDNNPIIALYTLKEF